MYDYMTSYLKLHLTGTTYYSRMWRHDVINHFEKIDSAHMDMIKHDIEDV